MVRVRITGNPSDVIDCLEEFLKYSGYSFKKSIYGRIYVFKIGFLKSIKVVVYSDGYVDVYGSKSLIDKFIASTYFRTRGLVVVREKIHDATTAQNLFDELVGDIIEARILAKKIKWARRDLMISSLIFLSMFLAVILSGMLTVLILLLLIYILVLVVPRRIYGEKGDEWWYIPVNYWRYKTSYERLIKSICNRYMFLPTRQKEKIKTIFNTDKCC
ncbi:hypothetical protein J4526_00755 [Desulfurococcaceae archaeon MEX13E-LK6-19]|nr:hypothetical protein J4526_00755 [Desulfurococcaceae archaeon MEX13E-LK6-19]